MPNKIALAAAAFASLIVMAQPAFAAPVATATSPDGKTPARRAAG